MKDINYKKLTLWVLPLSIALNIGVVTAFFVALHKNSKAEQDVLMFNEKLKFQKQGDPLGTRIADKLQLKGEQRTKFLETISESRKTKMSYMDKIKTEHIELIKILSQPSPDDKIVNERIDKLMNLHNEELKSTIELINKQRSILEPQQFQQVIDWLFKRMDKGRHGRNGPPPFGDCHNDDCMPPPLPPRHNCFENDYPPQRPHGCLDDDCPQIP